MKVWCSMLKLAYPYKDQLKVKFMETMFNEKYKYYHSSNFCDYELKLSDSSWTNLDFISVDKHDNILGFLGATIHRGDDMITSLQAINFYDLNYAFSKDFHQFITDLFDKFKFRKMVFNVVIGNPAEKMYDKYIKKYNGRVVGIKIKEVKLYDGDFYDQKIYEIFRDDYLKAR